MIADEPACYNKLTMFVYIFSPYIFLKNISIIETFTEEFFIDTENNIVFLRNRYIQLQFLVLILDEKHSKLQFIHFFNRASRTNRYPSSG